MLNLEHYISNHIAWSLKTFGAGLRTKGITNHIRSELEEIEERPARLEEWIDVIILAIDGAWRTGHGPKEIVGALEAKQQINFRRRFPRPESEDQPSYHHK